MTEAPLTELDHKLREMALHNWAQFVQFIGRDAITSAKVCLLRQRQQSYQQISKKLNISEMQTRYACDKCKEKKPVKN